MFSKRVIESDSFLELSKESQSLYFHLNMRADDDGFVNNPKKVQRMIGATEDDLKLLTAKRFILCFDNGVIVIKHWRMHNLLRKDRYTETQYVEQLKCLKIKENGAYTEADEDELLLLGNQVATKWQPNGNQMATQVSIVKDSKVEYRVVEVSGEEDTDNGNETQPVDNSVDNSKFEYVGGTVGKGVVLLTEAQQDALLDKLGFDAFNFYVEKLATFIIEKKAKVGSHYNTILKWAKEDSAI